MGPWTESVRDVSRYFKSVFLFTAPHIFPCDLERQRLFFVEAKHSESILPDLAQ